MKNTTRCAHEAPAECLTLPLVRDVECGSSQYYFHHFRVVCVWYGANDGELGLVQLAQVQVQQCTLEIP